MKSVMDADDVELNTRCNQLLELSHKILGGFFDDEVNLKESEAILIAFHHLMVFSAKVLGDDKEAERTAMIADLWAVMEKHLGTHLDLSTMDLTTPKVK